jgi:hypothetical protein
MFELCPEGYAIPPAKKEGSAVSGEARPSPTLRMSTTRFRTNTDTAETTTGRHDRVRR